VLNLFKSQFLLDPQVIFLNHGSFGAVPRPVFETYQRWQRELESQPVEFLDRRFAEKLADARAKLAAFLHVDADEVVFFTNPTTAVNMVARNLARLSAGVPGSQNLDFVLRPGDEVLSTDHEYGALNRTWRYICGQTGACYVTIPIPLPVDDQAGFVERFWAGVNDRTRLIFISHITSSTALLFPVAEICRRARQAGILCFVDGAHAPGQIPLDLHALGADIYTAACHKWLCAPKGSAFLYVRRAVQTNLDPLVVSWGYESEKPSESPFIDYHEWQGTRDPAAFLSVPAAIEFQAGHDWDAVRSRCHALAVETRSRIEAITGLSSICPEDWFRQMFAARLPETIDLSEFKNELYGRYKIEAPTVLWNAQKFLRVSFQAYNDEKDADRLVAALRELV
jgi:isopenicillin-N epimerase